jgi:integrase
VLPSGKISWGYSLDHGKGADGKRKQEFKSGYRRQSEAEDATPEASQRKRCRGIDQAGPATFAGFMAEWFREHADRQCILKTVERYRQLAEYVNPYIGSVKLQDLTALSLERAFNRLKDSGGREEDKEGPPVVSENRASHRLVWSIVLCRQPSGGS